MLRHPVTRRQFLKAAACGTAAFTIGGCMSSGAHAPRPRKEPINFLWISCEDISPDLGCYGDKYADTPNLDRLAGQGCRYSSAFVSFPVCAPTRSSIITGVHPGTLGSMHMRTSNKGYEAVPPPEVKCFTEYLRAAGYYCTNNSKTDYQFNPPFTAWDESGKKAHWRNRPGGTPFFSVFNLTITHESQCWPKQGETLIHDPNKAAVPPYYPDTPVVRENLARYYDNITKMDKQAGDILRQLEEDGLAENTVVFFWSDHGRGLPRCKRWPYDSGLHVPLIIRRPGVIEPATVCDDLVNLIDLAPTLLSLADVPVPSYMQGRVLLGPHKGKAPNYVFGGRNRMDAGSNDHIRTARDKRYRYIRNFAPKIDRAQRIEYMEKMPIMQEWRRLHAEGKLNNVQNSFFQQPKPAEELYDLANDPYEVNNLADLPRHQQILKQMRAALEKWIKDIADLGGLDEEELINRMWPGRKQPVTAAPAFETTPLPDGSMRVKITSTTRGASIGYRFGGQGRWYRFAGQGRWMIYSKPIIVKADTAIEAKAIRIGYAESKMVQHGPTPQLKKE